MRVGVAGAAGRMGREVCKAVVEAPDMQLVFAVGKNKLGEPVREWAGEAAGDLRVTENLSAELYTKGADVIVDFTHPTCAADNALLALGHGAIPIIGTSGLTEASLDKLKQACEDTNLPALYIPNFAIGAVLMMKFCKEAAKYYPDAEIIELHHNKKADAPSGTAMRTADLIANARRSEPAPDPTELQKAEGARGANVENVRIHSVRLPGLLAHQQVLFGGPGELLTIRHDSTDRTSFMQGVLLAIRKSQTQSGLVTDLESLLE